MAKHPADKHTIEMPLSTPAKPLTEKEIRDKLNKIAYGKDKKAGRMAREALAKRMRYKSME